MCAHACSVNVSCVPLFATPWTVAHQAPLSTGLYRQEQWSELPDPPPGDLPHPRIEPMSPAFPALASLPLSRQGCLCVCVCVCVCVCLVAQSCATLCDIMDCSPPGSSVQGILQTKYWNGLSFSTISDFPGGASGKEPTYQFRRCKRRGFDPWVGKIP